MPINARNPGKKCGKNMVLCLPGRGEHGKGEETVRQEEVDIDPA